MRFVSAKVAVILALGGGMGACAHRSQAERPSDYAAELRSLSEALARHATPANDLDRLRRAQLRKARTLLSGDLDDLRGAMEDLDALLDPRREPDGSLRARPYVLRAQLLQHVHRFREAERDLVEARRQGGPPDGEIEIALLEFDSDLNLGRYARAAERLRTLRRDFPQAPLLVREAQLARELGRADEARRKLDESRGRVLVGEKRSYAWHFFARGLVALGEENWELALADFERASQEYSGYWLFDEHRAECLARLGRLEEAERIYRVIVADPGHSWLYDFALAGVLKARGLAEKDYAPFVRRGFEKLDAEARVLPEAVTGHALETLLEWESPLFPRERILAMSRENARSRPNGESLVLHAQVLTHFGEHAEAKEAYCRAWRSAFRGPSLAAFEAKAKVFSRDCRK